MQDVNGYHVTIKIGTNGFDDEQLQRAYSGLGPGSAGWHELTDTLTLSTLVRDDDFGAAVSAGMDMILASFVRSGIEGEIRSMEVEKNDPEATAEELRTSLKQFFVGTAETADLLGVSKQRVSQLATTHADFPKPIKQLKSGPVYDRHEMVAWEASWERRRTGRPRKTGT